MKHLRDIHNKVQTYIKQIIKQQLIFIEKYNLFNSQNESSATNYCQCHQEEKKEKYLIKCITI